MKSKSEKLLVGTEDALLATKDMMAFVKKETGQDIRLCYQCGKCTAGCPASYAMDNTPRQTIRAAQLGLKDEILKSSAIWLCLSCQVCSTRCPRNLNIAAIMEAFRHLAIIEKEPAAEKDIALFNSIFLDVVNMFGRAHEVALTGLYNMRSGHFTANMNLLPTMLLKNKLVILPPRGVSAKQVKKIVRRVKTIENESK
jgi:heterodisulfide reductase subunit C